MFRHAHVQEVVYTVQTDSLARNAGLIHWEAVFYAVSSVAGIIRNIPVQGIVCHQGIGGWLGWLNIFRRPRMKLYGIQVQDTGAKTLYANGQLGHIREVRTDSGQVNDPLKPHAL